MRTPLAFAIQKRDGIEAYRVSIDGDLAAKLRHISKLPPAVVVVKNASILPNISAGLIHAEDVLTVAEGDWSNAILVITDEGPKPAATTSAQRSGDERFLAHVSSEAPKLLDLAKQTLVLVRAKGIDGDLAEASGGRWVNRPINTFTLKVQPRVGNLHFTLYGNPQTFDANGFLLQDQNSYSRGWVRDEADASQFAKLAAESHARRRK